MSTLADIVAQLESGGGANIASQPSNMVNPTYGQYAGFANQYGSGASGIDNYASQVLASNPNATLGDFYSSYVLGTGNPNNTYNVGDLASIYPSAYSNLLNNAGYSPSTSLSSLLGGTSATASSSATTLQDEILNALKKLQQYSPWNLGKKYAGDVAGEAVSAVEDMLLSSRMIMLATGIIIFAAGVFSFKASQTVVQSAGNVGYTARNIRDTANAAATKAGKKLAAVAAAP